MSYNNDFEIENGELKKYHGNGGDVIIPDSVTSIGDWAFSGCSDLISITLPNSVTSIGEWAFNDCSALTSITIPVGVTGISDYTFSDCAALTSVTIPDGVTSIGNLAFSDCAELTSVTIPDSVISIGSNAFAGCRITSISLPDSVTSIGEEAFAGCYSLTNITIPNSITSIGEDVFSDCESLEYIICSMKTAEMLDDYLLTGTLGYFWEQYKNGNATEGDADFWIENIIDNIPDSFRALKNDIEFYRFALEECEITAKEAEDILKFTTSLECRAILLEYLKYKGTNS